MSISALPSLITVQLGQCGNQVGCELFRTLSRECFNAHDSDTAGVFFRELRTSTSARQISTEAEGITNDRVARAILVDMEPKAIQQAGIRSVAKRSSAKQLDDGDWFQYSKNRTYYRQSGSGNNWAYGYGVHGPQSYDDTVRELIRREMECCDRFGGFLFLQSLAGGTGSGVGACITERLRDEYPHSMMVNQVVWPYDSGEVSVQNYNAILTLSTLQQNSDAVLLFENDQLNLTCTRLLNLKSPSFADMNRVIANNLCHTLLPCGSVDPQSGTVGKPMRLWQDYIEQLCCHPSYKMLTCKFIPHVAEQSKAYDSFLWRGLSKHLHQMLITNAAIEEGINWHVKLPSYRSPKLSLLVDDDGEGEDHAEEEMQSNVASGKYRDMTINKSVANVVIARGANLKSAVRNGLMFGNPLLYASWSQSQAVKFYGSPVQFNEMDKSISMISNSQSVVQPLNRVLYKASEMFHSSAYLHMYAKYGMENDQFMGCLAQMEQVLNEYRSLS